MAAGSRAKAEKGEGPVSPLLPRRVGSGRPAYSVRLRCAAMSEARGRPMSGCGSTAGSGCGRNASSTWPFAAPRKEAALPTRPTPIALPSGETVPALGQGTWQMGDDPSRRYEEIAALRLGLDLGLTLIDTAAPKNSSARDRGTPRRGVPHLPGAAVEWPQARHDPGVRAQPPRHRRRRLRALRPV